MTYTVGSYNSKYSQEQGAPISTRLQELLWRGHEDLLFEAHPGFSRIDPMPYQDALKELRSGAGFFAPVPRIALGNKREHCALSFDALWVDIDDKPGVDPHALLDTTLTRLPVNLRPSAVVFSGNKGIHCDWKLASLLPIEEIEFWNKALAYVVGGDSCHDRTRILAHPGTPHRKTGKLIEIIDFSAEVHPVDRLNQLPEVPRPNAPRKSKPRTVDRRGQPEEWLEAADGLNCWGEPPRINLWARLSGVDLGYLRGSYGKGWKRGPKTRSEVEASIVSHLVGEGASDEQIIEIADGYFSKHIEESPKRGDGYIDHTIRSARRDWFEKGWLTHPLGGGKKKKEAKYRASSVADLGQYLELVRGQPLSEWVAEVRHLGKSRQSAYRYKDGLKKVGLVEVKGGNIFRVPSK